MRKRTIFTNSVAFQTLGSINFYLFLSNGCITSKRLKNVFFGRCVTFYKSIYKISEITVNSLGPFSVIGLSMYVSIVVAKFLMCRGIHILRVSLFFSSLSILIYNQNNFPQKYSYTREFFADIFIIKGFTS